MKSNADGRILQAPQTEGNMPGAKKLGDMLKEAGLIDDFQLQSALSHQRNWGGKLGSILIDLEFVREEELARVMSDILRIPYINLFEPEIPEAVIKLIKGDIAKKHHVVPVKREGGALILAMFDPLDLEAIDEVRFITGLNVKPSLAMGSEIKDAIRKYYDGEEIDRTRAKELYHQPTRAAGKMEIIRGSDLGMPKTEMSDIESSLLSKEDAAQQTLRDTRVRLDALISVLIEKKLITRDELATMTYQKKMGL
jgi:type IV pilus assembly protein PilB